MIFSNIKNNKGQSLIELVVAVSIILIGVVSTLVLTISTIRGGKASEMQTIAGNLAREGVEVIKQQRYSNWLKIEANELAFTEWDEGLVGDGIVGSTLAVDFNPSLGPVPIWEVEFNVEATSITDCINNNNCRLYFKDGIYYHQIRVANPVGTPTPFYRLIYINPICLNPTTEVEKIETSSYVCTGAGFEKIGLQVISEVRWMNKNSWISTKFEDHLYNWK